MKSYIAPLLIAFALFAIAFLALDFTIMKLHGLTLIYHR